MVMSTALFCDRACDMRRSFVASCLVSRELQGPVKPLRAVGDHYIKEQNVKNASLTE